MSNSIPNIVTFVLSDEGAAPEQQGFGVPLCMVYHTLNVDLFREYTSAKAVKDDGFNVNSPAYKMAQAAFSSGNLEKIIIGRRANAFTQTVRLTPTVTTLGHKHSITVRSPAFSTEQTVTFTNGGAETTTTISTGLKALLDALLIGEGLGTTFLTATVGAGFLDVATITPGLLYTWSSPSENLLFEDRTTDPGIVSDVTNILDAAGGGVPYAISLDSRSKAQIVALASEALTRQKLLLASTMDSESIATTYSPSGTDVGSVLLAASQKYTALCYSRKPDQYLELRWASERLPLDPGSNTWKFAQPSGATAEVLSDTQKARLLSKQMNFLAIEKGVSHMQEGWTSSNGVFIDEVIGNDWFVDQGKVAVFGAFLSNPKIAFTDAGVNILSGAVRAVAEAASDAGLIVPESDKIDGWKITVTPVSKVSSANKSIRKYGKITLDATYQGAIHKLDPVQINFVN